MNEHEQHPAYRLTSAQRRATSTVLDPRLPPDLTLPGETAIGVAGDWENQPEAATVVIERIAAADPTVRRIAQLGDLWLRDDGSQRMRSLPPPNARYLRLLDAACDGTGIERIDVTPGNHDHWPRLLKYWSLHPNEPLQVSRRVWMLPRGARFTIAARQFTSFGGAASINRSSHTEGLQWWETEVATADEVSQAMAAGPTDVLLLHEAVNAHVPSVIRVLHRNTRWSERDLRQSQASRERVTLLRSNLHPLFTFHGHMNAPGSCLEPDGGAVVSLGDAGRDRRDGTSPKIGNAGILRLQPVMRFHWLDHVPAADDQARGSLVGAVDDR